MRDRRKEFDKIKEAKRVARQTNGSPKATQVIPSTKKQKVRTRLSQIDWLDPEADEYDVYD